MVLIFDRFMGEINSKLPEEIKFSRSNILTDALNRPVKSFSSADTAAVSKLPKKVLRCLNEAQHSIDESMLL